MRHDAEVLKEAARQILLTLVYNADSGIFTWLPRDDSFKNNKQWNSRWAGKKAGSYSERYILINLIINGKQVHLKAHRVAWFMVNGEWPELDIDHINQDSMDNRISNLRQVSASTNGRNKKGSGRNTSGFTGVSFCSRRKTWIAYAQADGKRKTLVGFQNPEAAYDAIKKYREDHGYTSLHGVSP